MSYIPDCRTDENYNDKYLNSTDKEFVAGYDYAVEQVLNLIDYNSDVDDDLENLLDTNIAVVNVDKKAIIHKAVKHWMESERDMLVTSMIDNMAEDEYEQIKTTVDSKEVNADVQP